MKRIVLVAAVAMLSLASCKKDYVCTVSLLGTSVETDFPGLNKSDADEAKIACETGGLGVWSTK